MIHIWGLSFYHVTLNTKSGHLPVMLNLYITSLNYRLKHSQIIGWTRSGLLTVGSVYQRLRKHAKQINSFFIYNM
jgi:hypothetical protein